MNDNNLKARNKTVNRYVRKKRQVHYNMRIKNYFKSQFDFDEDELVALTALYKYDMKKNKNDGNRESYHYNKVGHQKFKKDLNHAFKGPVLPNLEAYDNYIRPSDKRARYELF